LNNSGPGKKSIINLNPRQLDEYRERVAIPLYEDSDNEKLNKCNKVYYTYEKGKKYFNKRKILISKFDSLSDLKNKT
jgi:hypothetical protein